MVQLTCHEVRNTVSSWLPSRNCDRVWDGVRCSAVTVEEGQWLRFCSLCVSYASVAVVSLLLQAVKPPYRLHCTLLELSSPV